MGRDVWEEQNIKWNALQTNNFFHWHGLHTVVSMSLLTRQLLSILIKKLDPSLHDMYLAILHVKRLMDFVQNPLVIFYDRTICFMIGPYFLWHHFMIPVKRVYQLNQIKSGFSLNNKGKNSTNMKNLNKYFMIGPGLVTFFQPTS